MSKRKKRNRYVAVYLTPGEEYDGSQSGRGYRSHPAARGYAKRMGPGFVVRKIIRKGEGDHASSKTV